jgi:2-desacetyl-2-hydroxyethyl bacteriochlorophyllide A dehydrogenase
LRAAVAEAIPTLDLTVRAGVTLPATKPPGVLVQVEACGICGTDLHILSGGSYKPDTPFVLGHEPVGRVTVDVDQRSIVAGQLVTMTIFEGCGRCEYCVAGDERLCPQLQSIIGVYRRWGGFAEQLLVPAAQLVPVPAAMSAIVAASLVDAGATAANASRVVVGLRPSNVIVLGGGPVGLLTAELIRLDGLASMVVEPNNLRRTELERRGFRTSTSIRDLLDQQGVDCIIDCVGVAEVVTDSLSLLQPHGSLVVVGYTKTTVDFSVISRKELRVLGVRSGSRIDLERILDLVNIGAVSPPSVTAFELDRINQALHALRAGELQGKAIVTPQA